MGVHRLILRKVTVKLHQYPEEYRRQRKLLLRYHLKEAQSRYCNVYTTFEASAHVLEQSNSEAAKDALRLLEILSMLDSSFLPLQIFEDAWNGCHIVLRTDCVEVSSIGNLSHMHVSQLPSFMVAENDKWTSYRLIEACALLASLSLITRHNLDGSPGISMHQLTHAWAKDRQGPEQQSVAWITTGCVLGFSRSNEHLWRTQERRLLPHIQSYLDIEVNKAFSFASKTTVIPIFLICGWALRDMRQDSRLGHLIGDIFVELGKNPEEPSDESLPLYDLRAQSSLDLGRVKDAVELLQQVVHIRELTLAEDHPDRLSSQHDLTRAYKANGQVKEAVELLQHIVKIRELTLAKDHPYRLSSQHVLAGAYLADGQVEGAVELLQHIVKIEDLILAEDHLHRLASQHELAHAYLANGQVEEAVELLQHVVKIQETTLAKEHSNRLNSQGVLAAAYMGNGQRKEAVELFEHVVKIRETTIAEDHPDRVVSEQWLAYCLGRNIS